MCRNILSVLLTAVPPVFPPWLCSFSPCPLSLRSSPPPPSLPLLFFHCRYIDWAITTPLLILNLGLLAGEDMVLVAAVMGADVAMIFSGYMGSVALVPTVKWLWFTIGIVVYIPVVIAIVRVFRQTLIDKYTDVDRIELYSKVSLLTIIVWSIYPIVWIFSVGTGGLGVSAESIIYAILDVCAKCVFSFMIVQFNVYESAAPATAKEYV